MAFNLRPSTSPCQQPQTNDLYGTQPLYFVNAKYVQGVGPGYWPTAGGGLILNLTAGTAWCGNPPAPVTYAGGALTMTASATNFVFLDPTQSCAPASIAYVSSAPAAPSLSQVSGGSLAATTYYVKITYVNAHGETTGSSESSLGVSANYYLQIASPASIPGATGWNAYVGTSSGVEWLQNSAPIALGTAYTMSWACCWNSPSFGGISSGWGPPTVNGTGLLPGEIPLASVTTNASAITSVNDLRTWNDRTQGPVVRADFMAGSDICAKIAAAIAALPGSGGIVDARSFTGQQPCSSDPFSGLGKPVELLLGDVTVVSSVAWDATAGWAGEPVTIRGAGEGDPAYALTTLYFTGATEGLIVQSGWTVSDLGIIGNGSTSTYGLDLSTRPTVNFSGYNIFVGGFQRGWYQNGQSQADCFDCLFSNNSQYGIYIDGVLSMGNVPTFTHFIGGRAMYNTLAGAYVGSSQSVNFENFDFEDNPGDGAQLGATSGEEARNTSFRNCWFEGNGTNYTSNYDIKAVRVRYLLIINPVWGSANTTPLHVYRNDNLSGTQAEYVTVQGGSLAPPHPIILDANVQGVQLINTGLSESSLLTDNATATFVLERNAIRENLNVLGNLGIGTTSPGKQLDVVATSLYGSGTAIAIGSIVDPTNNYYGYGQTSYQLRNPSYNSGAGQEIFSIGAEGDLSTSGAVTNSDAYIYNTGGGGGPHSYRVVLQGGGSTGSGNMGFGSNITSPATLSGAQMVILGSSGNVGIGTTSPQTTLDVAGPARTDPVAFSSLPSCSSIVEGAMRALIDSTTNTWGATISGGGSNHVLAYCDGSNWTVAAK